MLHNDRYVTRGDLQEEYSELDPLILCTHPSPATEELN